MRPEDLPTLFSWDERKPVFHDGVLCIPRYYDQYDPSELPILNHNEYFPAPQPLHIEICSGNGEWLAEQAQNHPQFNWIGIEKQFDRVRKLWSKKKNHGLINLLPICGTAEDTATYCLADACADTIYINFPDPWPKTRHSKHRLIQDPFIKLLARIAKPSCPLFIVTDDAPYAQRTRTYMSRHPEWELVPTEMTIEEYGSSRFCRLGQEKGSAIHIMHYRYTGRS